MKTNKHDWRLSPRFEYREDLVNWLNAYKIRHFEVFYAPAELILDGKDIQVIYKPSYSSKKL